ncbi:MAG: hypothetical protein WCV84_01565 [Patescibacteria group bacterium]
MSELLKSPWMRTLLVALGLCAVLSAVFTAGIAVGGRKARHVMGWCGNYERQFTRPPLGVGARLERDPRRGEAFPFAPPMLPGGHGVFGKVLSVAEGSLMVQGKDTVEQEVLVTTSTQIRLGRDEQVLTEIKPDMAVAVFGAPNGQGQIDARLIRVIERP